MVVRRESWMVICDDCGRTLNIDGYVGYIDTESAQASAEMCDWLITRDPRGFITAVCPYCHYYYVG